MSPAARSVAGAGVVTASANAARTGASIGPRYLPRVRRNYAARLPSTKPMVAGIAPDGCRTATAVQSTIRLAADELLSRWRARHSRRPPRLLEPGRRHVRHLERARAPNPDATSRLGEHPRPAPSAAAGTCARRRGRNGVPEPAARAPRLRRDCARSFTRHARAARAEGALGGTDDRDRRGGGGGAAAGTLRRRRRAAASLDARRSCERVERLARGRSGRAARVLRRQLERQRRRRSSASAGPVLRAPTVAGDAPAPCAVPERLHEPLERAAGRPGLGRSRGRRGGLDPGPPRTARGRRLGAGARPTLARPHDRRDPRVRSPRGRGVTEPGFSKPARETPPSAHERLSTKILRSALGALTAARVDFALRKPPAAGELDLDVERRSAAAVE